MKKLLIIAVFLLYGPASLLAQGDLEEQQLIMLRNERSFAAMLNSDGMGLGYREAKRIDYLNKRILEIDVGNLKHPKEYKAPNQYSQSAGTIIFGKMNSVFYIRGGIGHQHEIFKKADLGGVAIRYFFSGGPVIALYKPIFYRVLYSTANPQVYDIREEKFDVSIAVPWDIYGKASFFKGIKETKALPGIYGKGGFNFEYSKEDKVSHAIEIGAQINAFPKKIPIMASTENKAIYFSLFVSYRFGIIVDPLHPEETRLSNLFRRKKE
jgi:hypothetical protein